MQMDIFVEFAFVV